MVRGNKRIKMKRGRNPKINNDIIPSENQMGNPPYPNNTTTTPTTQYTPVTPPSYLPKRVINISNITPDELIFAYEWADNPKNPDKALLSAGITKVTDTPQLVQSLVNEYTNNPSVIQAFQESLFNRLESLQITENRIDSHLSIMAFTDIGLSKDENGNIIPLEKMTWEMRACIQEYEENSTYSKNGKFLYKKTKIKCYSKMDAMKTLRQNKKEDKALAMGIVKGAAGNTFNIQNNIHTQNNIGSVNSYNSEIKNVLDVEKLSDTELDIFLKAIGQEISPQAIEVENMIDGIVDI